MTSTWGGSTGGHAVNRAVTSAIASWLLNRDSPALTYFSELNLRGLPSLRRIPESIDLFHRDGMPYHSNLEYRVLFGTGLRSNRLASFLWIPAFAGMTKRGPGFATREAIQ